ncbi:hypothetical protein ACU4GD_44095 [Cupriavidus basilensis]
MEMPHVIVAHTDAPHGGAGIVVAHGAQTQAVDFIVNGGEDTEGHGGAR